MIKIIPFFCLYLFFLLPSPALSVQDSLVNIPVQPTQQELAPGAVLMMPDGRQTIIMEMLPNGDMQTDLGIAISPQGIIRSGEYQGQAVKLDPAFSAQQNVTVVTPENKIGTAPVIVQEKSAAQLKPEVAVPDTTTQKTAQPAAQAPKTAVQPRKNAVETPAKQKAEEQVTLAQMIPLTAINPDKAQAPKKPETEKQAKQPEKKATSPKEHPVKEHPAKPAPEKKAEPRQPKKQARVAVGEELRIPPEAIKNGNLDFMEGCWQGTRPEYFSKRTIRECFCFGANGKNGKRRIYDSQGGRMCIGATRAHLSQSGVLSVTSEGAACNDGERWGQAEMVCKNSGPKTPCSWIFKDANNGRQAYTIPFVRVEQCGR